MDEWLKEFIDEHADCGDLECLAHALAKELNRDAGHRGKNAISGFHIAGFNNQGLVEFWYVRNVADDRQALLGEYQVRRDYRRDPADNPQPGTVRTFRNGDLRPHVAAWEGLDASLGQLIGAPGFRGLATPNDYVRWVKFKMAIIIQFYKNWSREKPPIIGEEPDVFCVCGPG